MSTVTKKDTLSACRTATRSIIAGFRVNKAAFLLIFFLFPALLSFSQSSERKKLEQERKSIQREIALTNQLLESTRQKKSESLNELKLLRKQILLRQELLNGIRREVKAVNTEISDTEEKIEQLKADIAEIQKEYGDLSYAMYRSRSQTPALFYIFSAESVSQGLSRIRYFRELSEYMREQVEEIKRKKAYLASKKLQLLKAKADKEAILATRKKEVQKLRRSKEERDELYAKLKTKELAYKRIIAEKRAALKELENTIKELIAKEKKTITKAEYDRLLPLNASFEKNKGRLPWPLPTSKGVITTSFGITKDEEGLETNSTGVDISTEEDQLIRAIFEGEVVMVQEIPFLGGVVMIRHGLDYRSVYANLDDVFVQTGQQINKLDKIGVAKTDKESGETKVHFQLFHEKHALDPEFWLVKKK